MRTFLIRNVFAALRLVLSAGRRRRAQKGIYGPYSLYAAEALERSNIGILRMTYPQADRLIHTYNLLC